MTQGSVLTPYSASAKVFQQYIWLVNTLRQHKRLTLKEINDLWVKNAANYGNLFTTGPAEFILYNR